MIAVGVDVARLGVMVVNNQPKSTAEYIQATSRVGRRAPGLVFTVLNWARPRDLSHYETFESFHASIYQHVEALSVTPFADRAVDRGLTGVLASLVRNLKPDYNPNRGARGWTAAASSSDHAVRYLELRARDVLADQHVVNEVRSRLDSPPRLLGADSAAHPAPFSAYRAAKRQGDVAPLLLEPDSGPWRLMTCPTSLREVEPPIRLIFTGATGPSPTRNRPTHRARRTTTTPARPTVTTTPGSGHEQPHHSSTARGRTAA